MLYIALMLTTTTLAFQPVATSPSTELDKFYEILEKIKIKVKKITIAKHVVSYYYYMQECS